MEVLGAFMCLGMGQCHSEYLCLRVECLCFILRNSGVIGLGMQPRI